MNKPVLLVLTAWLSFGLAAAAPAAEDILIADFEGKDYGAWKVEGEAFGPGPARGTLKGQMHGDGFLGKALVNSYFTGVWCTTASCRRSAWATAGRR